jgi:tetratricopeptide (TPR) repeat protein
MSKESGSDNFGLPAPQIRPLTEQQVEALFLARAKDPGTERDLWNLIKFYCAVGRHPSALGYTQQMFDGTSDLELKAHCLFAMGCIQEQVKDYSAAIGFYRRALAMEPLHGETWYFINNNLGYCLNHFRRFAQAVWYCRTAIKADPNRHNAHKNLGLALWGLRHHTGAARSLQRAIRLCPNDTRALEHLRQLLTERPEVAWKVPGITDEL